MTANNISSFRPVWQGPFEAYARKFAAKNHWRVKHLCDEPEDTVQQCAVVFAYCCKLYGDQVDNAAWFMALYKRALETAFISLARADQRRARLMALTESLDEDYADDEDEPDYDPRRPTELPDAPLLTALAEASSELRQVLQVIGTAPTELLQLLLPDRVSEDDEATLSRSWCRLAHAETVRSDLLSELRMRI